MWTPCLPSPRPKYNSQPSYQKSRLFPDFHCWKSTIGILHVPPFLFFEMELLGLNFWRFLKFQFNRYFIPQKLFAQRSFFSHFLLYINGIPSCFLNRIVLWRTRSWSILLAIFLSINTHCVDISHKEHAF
jgi:hypothetical protein